MCDRCGGYYDPHNNHDTTEEEFDQYQAYWEDQYYAQAQREHDESVERNYEQHLRELHERAFERSETFIDV